MTDHSDAAAAAYPDDGSSLDRYNPPLRSAYDRARAEALAGRPTEAEIRERIHAIRQYGEAGWLPSPEAGNYAINELYWALGEEMVDPPFPLPVVVSDSTNPSAPLRTALEHLAKRGETPEPPETLGAARVTGEWLRGFEEGKSVMAEGIRSLLASRPLSDSTALIEEAAAKRFPDGAVGNLTAREGFIAGARWLAARHPTSEGENK